MHIAALGGLRRTCRASRPAHCQLGCPLTRRHRCTYGLHSGQPRQGALTLRLCWAHGFHKRLV
eukprot:7747755-Alexandrium_andersonii.AAC.1